MVSFLCRDMSIYVHLGVKFDFKLNHGLFTSIEGLDFLYRCVWIRKYF